MISLPLMKQTVKSNGILWLIFTAVLGVLLAQFASLEMTQFLLFLIQYGMMAMILPGIYILISSNKLLVGRYLLLYHHYFVLQHSPLKRHTHPE